METSLLTFDISSVRRELFVKSPKEAKRTTVPQPAKQTTSRTVEFPIGNFMVSVNLFEMRSGNV